jgi:hypothetical protein
MRQYVETDLEADREVANTLAELIIGGSLASLVIGAEPDHTSSADNHDQGDDDPRA